MVDKKVSSGTHHTFGLVLVRLLNKWHDALKALIFSRYAVKKIRKKMRWLILHSPEPECMKGNVNVYS